jgi:hypothetical protein
VEEGERGARIGAAGHSHRHDVHSWSRTRNVAAKRSRRRLRRTFRVGAGRVEVRSRRGRNGSCPEEGPGEVGNCRGEVLEAGHNRHHHRRSNPRMDVKGAEVDDHSRRRHTDHLGNPVPGNRRRRRRSRTCRPLKVGLVVDIVKVSEENV